MSKGWRAIPGFQGRYLVSTQGEVKSVYRLKCNKEKDFRPKILKPMVYESGLSQVVLCRYENKTQYKKTLSIHRLVAMCFLPDYDEKLYVDHIDHDMANNNVENLRMATNRQNQGNRNIAKIKQTCKYKGVHVDHRTGRYRAIIRDHGTRKHIGIYESAEDAAKAYDKELIKVQGKYALTNEMLGMYMDGTPKEEE